MPPFSLLLRYAGSHGSDSLLAASRKNWPAMSVGFSSPFPILAASDLARSAAVYERLGFVETYRYPSEGKPEFVALELDGASLGIAEIAEPIHRRPLEATSGYRGFELCVYTTDVDAAVEALRAGGVPVLAEPADQPWGERLAYVEDPDGNPVHLTTPIGRKT